MHRAGGKVLVDFATRRKRLPSNGSSKSVQMVQKCNNRCDFMSKIRYFKILQSSIYHVTRISDIKILTF